MVDLLDLGCYYGIRRVLGWMLGSQCGWFSDGRV